MQKVVNKTANHLTPILNPLKKVRINPAKAVIHTNSNLALTPTIPLHNNTYHGSAIEPDNFMGCVYVQNTNSSNRPAILKYATVSITGINPPAPNKIHSIIGSFDAVFLCHDRRSGHQKKASKIPNNAVCCLMVKDMPIIKPARKNVRRFPVLIPFQKSQHPANKNGSSNCVACAAKPFTFGAAIRISKNAVDIEA